MFCECFYIQGVFGPYGPYSHFNHHDKHKKPHPFVLKHHDIEHIPHKDAGFRLSHKHIINKTALCSLKGGECTEPINCVGMQQFFCEGYTKTCCYNTTKHVKFVKKHRLKDFINKTALCIAKGGICSGAGTCFGSQQFACLDESQTCCFNSSTGEVIVKKIIFPQKKPLYKLPRRPRKRRRKFPYLQKPHPVHVNNFIYAHPKGRSLFGRHGK